MPKCIQKDVKTVTIKKKPENSKILTERYSVNIAIHKWDSYNYKQNNILINEENGYYEI